ncbi:PucR family transcriptional regulator [Anaerotruncus sp. 80]|jgi:purine catabolism regulator|uniref:PucR family transcriptional regulator n=2 Tax=Clostridia TaxID=186801 RepID=A0A845QIV2_9FIRM|nr:MULTISPECIES: PucR family transcriptional regulator [Anaerotruncus]NBH61394.1 PucR family transcriptional regulator [Anaerotruncus colihominis]NCE99103.1 PucR family transcriptional regulator [Emergencia sp. 1XD21-10]NCF02049.1 PucR family transcriptional regulator [Anaerotruncus sp. 80]
MERKVGRKVMLCTIELILKQPLFENAKVLAGKKYLDNVVNRTSVYDCSVKSGIFDKSIVKKGDLYISGLDQFATQPQEFTKFIQVLVNFQCSALIITDENAHLITEEIKEQCNRGKLPLIMVSWTVSYASIMETINNIIIQKYYHIFNGNKLNEIHTGKLNDAEKKRVLESINPKFKKLLQIVIVRGNLHSPMMENDLMAYFLKRQKDVYIFHDNLHYFLISHDSEEELNQIQTIFCNYLEQYFSNYTAGVSAVHPKKEVNLCLDEGLLALDTAYYLQEKRIVYDNKSILTLIMKLKDSSELYSYYDSLKSLISIYRSENDSTLFNTCKMFVQCKGSYRETANLMGQSEATIRYRINKLRQILGFEDDIVQFHTCITMLTMIDRML